MNTRTEHDSLGPVEVPADALWGAQTERSRRLFTIGGAGRQRMPLELIHAMARIKGAAAQVNAGLGRLDAARAGVIAEAALRVAVGEFDDAFALSIWQTGSGTQSHMNVNEVIARLASQALADQDGAQPLPVHPNDHVNLGQSSNDVFPTAMHIAALQGVRELEAALDGLRSALQEKAAAWAEVIKVGRTHLQDATPVTLGQEFGGYDAQLGLAAAALAHTLPAVQALAIGGTAVGTGLNTHREFGPRVAAVLARRLGEPYTVAGNLFAALAGHEPLVSLHAALRTLAVALIKIASDIRLMGSGPRAGLGELQLPENEPGSSIMPGKVNPTQVEALLMVCYQVLGHDVAIGIAASQGQFELNTCKPLIAANLLDSLRLLTDAMDSITRHCVVGLEALHEQLGAQLDRNLMAVTALTSHIGYERAAAIARHAHQQRLNLREAAVAVGGLSAVEFDAWVQVGQMLGPTG